jgi:hypothetical protein
MIKALVGILLGACIIASTAPALAQESGLASMHTWRKVGKKTCMADHYHGGSGTGSSQKAAETAAERDWMSFTDLEYGQAWANVRLAVNRTTSCNRTGANEFSCRIDAMACRPF